MTKTENDLINRIEQARLAAVAAPDDPVAAYRLALAYARAGATAEARRVADEAALQDRFEAGPGDAPVALWEDMGCVQPRLAKDDALREGDPDRRRAALLRAAAGYERVARRTGGTYPLINAATLNHLGGEPDRAKALAAETLAIMGGGPGDFWAAATAAEARLLLGDESAAAAHLDAAFRDGGPSYDDAATTLGQLRRIVTAGGGEARWLDDMAPPPVAHFTGRMIGPLESGAGLAADAEPEIAALLRAELEEAGRPGPWRAGPYAAAYGALAAGADILAAEWMLEAGAPLHVVLPFEPDQFLATSVRPYGSHWIGRFRACLAAAADVRIAAEGEGAPDPALFAYGSRFAMGLAALHARRLGTEAIQFALTEGGGAARGYGTDRDSDIWLRSGRRRVVVEPPAGAVNEASARAPAEGKRKVRAILFADVKGFSGLPDAQVPAFTKCVFGAIADTLAPYREGDDAPLLEVNTWGDALFAVFEDEAAAAAVAIDLVSVAPAASRRIEGLSAPMSIRVGGHLGPVFEEWNAVLGRKGSVGAHVSRGARVEPVAPVGAVWITEHFAAALELSSPGRFTCEFIGRSELAKGYGALCVYRLDR